VYRASFEGLFDGAPEWQALRADEAPLFPWRARSTFLKRPSFFDGLPHAAPGVAPIMGMRPLAILGDMVTTDHLSPNNTIAASSPGGRYLGERGEATEAFQAYVLRRGIHEMPLRGTFASGRLKSAMTPGMEGAVTTLQPDAKVMPIFDSASIYRDRGVPLIV